MDCKGRPEQLCRKGGAPMIGRRAKSLAAVFGERQLPCNDVDVLWSAVVGVPYSSSTTPPFSASQLLT